MRADTDKPAAWTPTKVQFLYRHLNRRYYVRTFAGGKEKRTRLKITLFSVAKNRMKEHLDAAERQKSAGELVPAMGKLTFGEVMETYRQQLQASGVRPNSKASRTRPRHQAVSSIHRAFDVHSRAVEHMSVDHGSFHVLGRGEFRRLRYTSMFWSTAR